MIGWFNKNFVRNNKISRQIGKFVHEAFDKRMKGDYDVLVKFDLEDVLQDFENMKNTIKVIKELINIVE